MLHERLAGSVGPRYRLEGELPGGGMARVFLTRDTVLDREVVVKVLPPERATATAMERFQREARLLARLNHPHIIPVLDSGVASGLAWFTMPRIDGETLADRLQRGALPTDDVRRLGLELLDAIGHAHRLGVIHRDIKPGNVFFHAGHALLADFGVASLMGTSGDVLTDEGVAVGTLGYMAPEHRLHGHSDERSDLWELGATLYEAATGRRWNAPESGDRWRGVPPELRQALRRALAERPADRWKGSDEFRDALGARRPPFSHRAWVAGVPAAVALLGWWQLGPGPMLPSPAVSTAPDLAFHLEDSSDADVREIARNAEFAIAWLPMIRVAGPHDGGRRARYVVRIARVSVDSAPLLELVGGDQEGTRRVHDRLPLSGRDPLSVSADVADRMVGAFFPERRSDLRLLAHSTTDHEALRAWYRGSDAFQASRWRDAETAYTDALRRDPDFTLATWSLALTRMWRRERHQEELEQLRADSSRLPGAIRALVEAQLEPHLGERMTRFDAMVAEWAGFTPALMLQANEVFHRGPLVGRPFRDGVNRFVAGASASPDLDHRTTWEHVLWGAIKLGDDTLARASWRRLRAWPGDRDRTAFLGFALDARFGGPAVTVRRGMLHTFATGERLATMSRYLRLGLDFDIPDEVARLAALVARRVTPREARAAALGAEATARLMSGRVGTALAALDRAGDAAPEAAEYRLQAAEWRLLLPGFGLAVAEGERRHALGEIDRWTRHPELWPRAAWTRAVVAAERGDAADLASWVDSLRHGSVHSDLARHLLPLAEAVADAGRGDIRAALLSSEAIWIDPGDAIVVARGPLVRAFTYHARGRWQLAQGDTAAAEREWRWHENNDLQGWPAGPPQDGELDAALSVPARMWRASLLCRHGQAEEGQRLLQRAESLWHDADASLGVEWPARRTAREACG